uniref:snake venom vascular endothelial growth factor toxin ICPP-like n=1 Tax=Monopterus albus TaxID=43700 RepID=UPI0009B43708|nr:snake venom vascular endothelial growth factor toxin ICPP-like [Monopterus albus]
MQRFYGTSHLLLTLLLQLVPAQISPTPEDDAPKEMTFQEVWAKSTCQPMELLVDVEQEFPGEVGYIYMPACVPLLRCSGCCGDENLECYPTLKRNITVQMMRITPQISNKHVQLTFVEHQRCDCRARPKIKKNKRGSVSTKSNPRRMKPKKTANSCGKATENI